ncbi:MAG: type II toxin-antitoxin system VapC family toxin [Bacteroidota bacterium]
MKVVLDVSAAFANLITAGQQKAIYQAWLASDLCLAPTLFHAEASSAAWKYHKINEVSVEESLYLLSKALQQVEVFFPVEELNEESLVMACKIDHSVYDCYYLALAQKMNAAILTNDKKLCQAAKKLGIESRTNLSLS